MFFEAAPDSVPVITPERRKPPREAAFFFHGTLAVMASADDQGLRCPDCGGPLSGFDPDDVCAGVRCLSCGYSVVTTNPWHPLHDETPYSVWGEPAGADRKRAIAAVAGALGIGVKPARDLIDGGRVVLAGAQAMEVRGLYRHLRSLGFRVRVEPAPRWRLDP